MPTIAQIQAKHAAYSDSLLAEFERQLSAIVSKAQTKTMARLQSKLSMSDGLIEQTAGNMRTLRSVNKVFIAEMDKAGFDALVESFVGEFHGQIQFVDQILKSLSSQMETPLPDINWTGKDLDVLGGFQANTAASIDAAVETAAGAALTRGMFSVGGLKFADLVDLLVEKLQTSIANAATIAETSQATFYQIAANRAYEQIQNDVPGQELKYWYSGPQDKLERSFCLQLTNVKKEYTRAQIDKMDNGQLDNVFVTRGGWRCRHQWLLSTISWESAKEAA